MAEDMDDFANGERKTRMSPSSSSLATENTILTPSSSHNQTYFSDQKVDIPLTEPVSMHNKKPVTHDDFICLVIKFSFIRISYSAYFNNDIFLITDSLQLP